MYAGVHLCLWHKRAPPKHTRIPPPSASHTLSALTTSEAVEASTPSIPTARATGPHLWGEGALAHQG